LKYTIKGYVKMNAFRINFSSKIQIEVIDSGVGISEENI
jgi:hypothetical protein